MGRPELLDHDAAAEIVYSVGRAPLRTENLEHPARTLLAARHVKRRVAS
jgi:hypothetical protein